jgi:hypothetical protein
MANPKTGEAMASWVFGYGTLVNEQSRLLTGTCGPVIGVRVSGYQRGWYAPLPEYAITALGVRRRPGFTVNGVLALVHDVSAFDVREKLYVRAPLERGAVKTLDDQQLPDGDYWVYIPEAPGQPSEGVPILQSYCDVCFQGALEAYGVEFTTEFIKTIDLWNFTKYADRAAPRYMRAFPSVLRAAEIDKLLAAHGISF